ncbi:MAG: arsenic resistance N-acetyltransferase ArsN2 [Syntrophales bacterium]
MPIELPLPRDEPLIRQLLILCELPQGDITPEHLRHFLVLKEEGQVIGVVGVEILARLGLLRSLAVDPRYRRRGFASHLAERAEECAASLKIEALYLLTITAEGFFAKRGYHRVERDSAPSSVRGTGEFKNLCPASAVCMVKYLKMK